MLVNAVLEILQKSSVYPIQDFPITTWLGPQPMAFPVPAGFDA